MQKNRLRKERHLIIGFGEVGKGIYEVLRKGHEVSVRDKDGDPGGRYDVLHLAYPWGRSFVRHAKQYIARYRPSLVIIHATVPIGTTRKVSPHAVHSPVRGVHPHLAEGIRTFVKYFGGRDAKRAAEIFARLGVKTSIVAKPETTELLKILDTTYYGWNILFEKEAHRIAGEFGLDFDEIYTHPNRTYNEGYTKLGMLQVVRPVLRHVPGGIGGHCVISNTNLLKSWLTRTLRSRNVVHHKHHYETGVSKS